MFITKITFESEKENEELLKSIIEKKLEDKSEVKGLLTTECWKSDKRDIIAYSIIKKWENKVDFTTWLTRPEHVEGHKNKKPNEDVKSKLKKTVEEYELLEF